MPNFAVINSNGIVTNLYVSESPLEPNDVQTETGQIGWSYVSGVFSPPPPPTLSPQQIIQNAVVSALAAGITITSTSTPAVNGTYACDGSTTSDINAEITSILLNSTFADGSSTISWPDTSGALHVFPSTDVFKSFATALASYVSNVRKYAVGVNQSLPSNSITIA